jgi:peptide/nickel transport system substrate-binding protein
MGDCVGSNLKSHDLKKHCLKGWIVSLGCVLLLIASGCMSKGEFSDSEATAIQEIVIDDDEQSISGTLDVPEDVTTGISQRKELSPQSGGAITVLLQDDLSPINGWAPWENICAWACRNVLDQVLETLTVVLPDGSVVPFLAKKINHNNNYTEWTVELRSGLLFSDGTPLEASIYKKGYDDYVKSGKVSSGLLRDARITSVNVLNDSTLLFELSEPNPMLLNVLAGPIGRVFLLETDSLSEEQFAFNPVGTGPFIFEGWSPGERIVLRSNSRYWRKDENGVQLPYLEEITFRQIADERLRLNFLIEGEGQILQTRSALAISQGRESELTVISRREDNVGVILFNTLESPTNDLRVRRGLLLSSDQEELGRLASNNPDASLAAQWVSPDSRWYSEAVTRAWPKTNMSEAKDYLLAYVQDPKRSDRRLTGQKIAVTLLCTDDLQLANMTRSLKSQWEATGLVDVTLEQVGRNALIKRVLGSVTDEPSFKGDFEASCWRVGGESDPGAQIEAFLGLVKTSPLNVANMEGDDLLSLVKQMNATGKFQDRFLTLENLMLELNTKTPMIYVDYLSSALIGDSSVEGLGIWTLPEGTSVLGQIAGVGRYSEVWLNDE